MNTNHYKSIKPLIIGVGVAGKRHLEAQLNLGIKTGIYSTNPQTKQLYKKNADVIVFDNLEQAIIWSNLVHVCTPDDKHTEYVAKALKRGKAVLCEKPFTTRVDDALYLQNLAFKYNSTLIIGQNYRLTPTFAETKKLVLKGHLGDLTRIETTYFHDNVDYHQRYSSKNFLYTGGSHAVDLACWIAKDQIVNLNATSQSELNYHTTLKFASGLKGEIRLDATSPRSISGTDLIVEGTKGKLVSHNKIDELSFFKKGDRNPQVKKLTNINTSTIAKEVKIVNDYLLGKISSYSPLPSVDEAVNIIKVLDTIDKSALKGKGIMIK